MKGIGLRRASILLALLAAAAIVVPASSAKHAGRATTEIPTLYVEYTMGCTFTIQDENGNTISSIPPGTYQIEVQTPIMFKLVDQVNRPANDFTGCKGWAQFQLTGPSVNLATTLDTGCDSNYLLPATVFKPNSTYSAVDLNQPTVAHFSFTTLASGTPQGGTNPYDPGKGTTSGPNTPIGEGSGPKVPLAGTLTGALSASGVPTLTLGGKNVTTLKAGRYRFTITDKDPKGAFTISLQGKVKDLTGISFVGRHTTGVMLTPGLWSYFSGIGKPVQLNVT
jgi:hypothetical protein